MTKIKKKTKKQQFLDIVSANGYESHHFDSDGNIVWNEPYRFPDEGRTFRPQCINHGCFNLVALFRGVIGIEKGRENRTVCSPCHEASYGKKPLRSGIVPHKKDYCENIDGHLGFQCTSTIHGSWVLELDHKDGNHLHNLPSNVETLCKICHSQKSRLAGDYKKATKQHTSPNKIQLNTFSPVDNLIPIPKIDPNLQNTIPCTEGTFQQQSLDFGDTQPIFPSLIS